MSHPNDPGLPAPASDPGGGSTGRHPYRKPAAIAAVVIAGLVLAPHMLPASASPTVGQVAAPAPVVPDGKTWIQGILTDQASHPLDNINVEVWPNDPTATEPVASNLTYAGVPADARHDHGVYRVEVPMNEAYRIVFSAVGGVEDGDEFRMQEYGKGRPIMVRSQTGVAAKAAALGRVRDLGTTQLVHQGRVDSAIKLKPEKVAAGKRGSLHVQITSPFVTDVTGKVMIRVSGKKVRDKVTASDHGTFNTRLPKFGKPGKYKATAVYAGSDTVARSKSKPVMITVKKPRK